MTLVILSLALVLGVWRSAFPARSPALVRALHVNLSLLTIAFATLHTVAAIGDPFARLSLIDAAVPFVSHYRPFYLGLGTLAADVFVIVLLTAVGVPRLGRLPWRWVHRSAYACWTVSVVHALGTGSDSTSFLFLGLDVIAVGAVVASFLGWRVAGGIGFDGWKRPAAALAVALACAGLVTWTVIGPLQPGWAQAAGTPPDLLRHPAP